MSSFSVTIQSNSARGSSYSDMESDAASPSFTNNSSSLKGPDAKLEIKRSKRRHIQQCGKKKYIVGGPAQGMINSESQESATFLSGLSGGYDHGKIREIMAKMILAHQLPFIFVELTWFNALMKYNNSLFQEVNRVTIKDECIKVFELEKEKMKKMFKNISRFSLTSDCWTSNQTDRYMSLTAHYVDADWKLQKRIISFFDLAPSHSGEVISDRIIECITEWGIQDKIGTITLDNASNNDKAAAILESNLVESGKLHFDGLFFHVRCCAHILNLVVEDGHSVIEGCVVKIREGVNYLRKSSDRLLKFGETAIASGIQTKQPLCIDDKTRWDSTHRMLESALPYKSAFHGYALRDPNFEWEPSEEEWASVSKVCNLLKIILDATNILSGTTYPTANLFLVEIFNVKKEICKAYESSDAFLRTMSKPMFEKFDKYWGEVEVVMAIACILDPRFKLIGVEYTFHELYPANEVKERVNGVTSKLRALYGKYVKELVASKAAASTSNTVPAAAPTKPSERSRRMEELMAFVKASNANKKAKSDLEVYLEEPVFLDGEGQFDVLLWWSQNCSKFPTLSKLARDVLCIPVTTMTSELTSTVSGHILDDYLSSLTKDMIELFICGGDWIRQSSRSTILTLQQAVIEEENLEIQVPMSNLNTFETIKIKVHLHLMRSAPICM
ncbi:hypothetical protein LUZ63_014510 [Rhynchospora breviuscula]|uniref:Transposase n=1 Tax=Rhynchospora breviuscula TaxID=2022672 RepID=A0A9Q0CAL2_9POAL|nr:hypothetical protein LUZ63_014510 [Rhynchospora breviuscula]